MTMCFRWMLVPPTALRSRCACGLPSSPATSCWTRAVSKATSPLLTLRSRRTSSRIIWRRWIRRILGSSIRNSTRRGSLSVFCAISVLPVPLCAQSVHVSGRVLNADSAAVPGARVVLHRVGQTVQGPIDSSRTDRQGGFRFSYRPDSATFYIASSRYAGIEYFSTPLPTNPARPDTSIKIVVYDTSSSAPVGLEARHLVLTRPGEDGSRGVLDLIMLRNPGRHTRIAPDTLEASWGLPLPRGTVGLE